MGMWMWNMWLGCRIVEYDKLKYYKKKLKNAVNYSDHGICQIEIILKNNQ